MLPEGQHKKRPHLHFYWDISEKRAVFQNSCIPGEASSQWPSMHVFHLSHCTAVRGACDVPVLREERNVGWSWNRVLCRGELWFVLDRWCFDSNFDMSHDTLWICEQIDDVWLTVGRFFFFIRIWTFLILKNESINQIETNYWANRKAHSVRAVQLDYCSSNVCTTTWH